MRVTEKAARVITPLVFAALTLGMSVGSIIMIELLVTTNQLIFALGAPVGVYLTIIFGQCLLRYADEWFRS